MGDEAVGDVEFPVEGDVIDTGDGARADERVEARLEVSGEAVMFASSGGLVPWAANVRSTASYPISSVRMRSRSSRFSRSRCSSARFRSRSCSC